MIAERILTSVLRPTIRQSMALSPAESVALPAPKPGHHYALYIHIPFCESLCPYCSFNRFKLKDDIAHTYFKNLREEIKLVAGLGYEFSTLYIGGGTPTVLVDELVQTIDLVKGLFPIREVSCETNPNHLTPENIALLEGRVQRLSVGIQSFDDGLLKQMGRYEKCGSGQATLQHIQQAVGHFPTLNLDMIFNFPSQTVEMLKQDAQSIIRSGANQVTFYPLMTSPSVRDSLRKSIGKVDYTNEAHYYEMISQGLHGNFEPSSAWTFSHQAGAMIDEYVVGNEEFVGLGSGAFSYLDGALYVNTFSLQAYHQSIAAKHFPVSSMRKFSKKERMRYRFMIELFGLNLDRQRFKEDFGMPVEMGLFEEMFFMWGVGALDLRDKRYVRLTLKGQYLAVVMMREFFAGVNKVRDLARKSLQPTEQELCVVGS